MTTTNDKYPTFIRGLKKVFDLKSKNRHFGCWSFIIAASSIAISASPVYARQYNGFTKKEFISRAYLLGAVGAFQCMKRREGYLPKSLDWYLSQIEKDVGESGMEWWRNDRPRVLKASREVANVLDPEKCTGTRDGYSEEDLGEIAFRWVKKTPQKTTEGSDKCIMRDDEGDYTPVSCTISMTAGGIINITNTYNNFNFSFKPMNKLELKTLGNATVTYFSAKKGEMRTFPIEWQWGSGKNGHNRILLFYTHEDKAYFSFPTTASQRSRYLRRSVNSSPTQRSTGEGGLSDTPFEF